MTVLLRDYQVEALMAWFRSGKRGIVELPTGTGKTYIGLKAIDFYRVRGKRSFVVVPTRVLMRQWRHRIVECLSVREHDVGLVYGREKSFKDITVSVINTAVKYTDKISSDYDLLILDEVHHYFAPKWYKIIEDCYDSCDVLGLSATVERHDNRHLNSLLRVVYSKSFHYMRKRNYVSQVRVYILRVPLSINERIVYEDLSRKIWRLMNRLHIARVFGDKKSVRECEYRVMSLVNMRKQLCSECSSKLPVILRIVREHISEKILVFAESIKSVIMIKEYLRKHGIKCETIHSKRKDRDKVLEYWKRGVFNVLLSVRVLDEGIDVPDCSVGIIVSNSLTKRQLVQRIGRIVRPKRGKVAKIYIIPASGTFEERVARKLKSLLISEYY